MRLVIISLDAVFAADSEYLLSLPNLGALAREGVFCDQVKTTYPTLTYSIHSSIITGNYPAHHGVGHNEPFQPRTKPERRVWYWDEAHIKTESLFSACKKAGRDAAAILWPVTGHSKNIKYNFPEVLALPGENNVLKVLAYGSTAWLLATELRYGRQRKSTKQPHLDDFTTLVAEKLILRQYTSSERLGRARDVAPSPRLRQRHMPDLLALHLVDCDAMRHQYGTFSDEAKAALMRLDARVGRIISALKARNIYQDTIIAVVTDHGQADITGSIPLDSWLQANHIPARAQSLGLGAYIHLNRADYHPVKRALTENMEELGLSKVYTREELRALHAPEEILLAVEPQEGLYIVDHQDQVPPKASHGFGLHHPGAKCLLWLRGPGFIPGARLSTCRVVDIAPTLAHAARLNLGQTDGQPLFGIMEGFDDSALVKEV